MGEEDGMVNSETTSALGGSRGVLNEADHCRNYRDEVQLPRDQVDHKPEAKRVGEGETREYGT